MPFLLEKFTSRGITIQRVMVWRGSGNAQLVFQMQDNYQTCRQYMLFWTICFSSVIRN